MIQDKRLGRITAILYLFFGFLSSCFPLSLTEFSNKCLSSLQEFSSPGSSNGPTPLSGKDFSSTLDTIIEGFKKSDLAQRASWVDSSKLSPAFFDPTFKTVQGTGFDSSKKEIGEFSIPYMQKLLVPENSKVCLMGDYHGSLHSLIRNLWRLVSLGYLDDNLRIKEKDLYLVFLGDLVNLGSNSSEIFYLALELKRANWNNVFILRGNHEALGLSNGDFKTEMTTKFSSNTDVVEKMFVLYRLLPHALFLGVQPDDPKDPGHDFVQCSHGGINCSTIKPDKNGLQALLTAPADKTYNLITDDKYFGFNNSVFYETGSLDPSGGAYSIGVQNAKEYLAERNLKAFFRGHQDSAFGLKMFFHEDYAKYISSSDADYDAHEKKYFEYRKEELGKRIAIDDEINAKVKDEKKRLASIKSDPTAPAVFFNKGNIWHAILDTTHYGAKGPYHWIYVVSDEDRYRDDGFLINNYVPIFTFTTATEGRSVPFDGFGILSIKKTYEEWRLKMFEHDLRENGADRNKKFVILKPEQASPLPAKSIQGYGLRIEWTDAKPNTDPIDPELAKKAHADGITPLTNSLTDLKNNLNALKEKLTSLTKSCAQLKISLENI